MLVQWERQKWRCDSGEKCERGVNLMEEKVIAQCGQ